MSTRLRADLKECTQDEMGDGFKHRHFCKKNDDNFLSAFSGLSKDGVLDLVDETQEVLRISESEDNKPLRIS